MAIKIKPGGTRKIKGMPPEKGFSVSFVPTPVTWPQGQFEVDLRDSTLVIQIGEYSTTTEPRVELSGNLKGLSMQLLPWDNTFARPTAILQGQQLRRYGDAASQPAWAHLEVKTEYGAKRYRHQYESRPEGEQTLALNLQTFDAVYKPGSLAYETAACAVELFAGATAGKAANSLFLDGGTYTLEGFSVQANPNFLAPQLDFSGVSVARSGNNSPWLPFTLISPRHAVFGAHIDGATVGDQVLFRRPDGSTQTVTILGEARKPAFMSGSTPVEIDLGIVYLSAPVTGCATYKVLPKDWERYLPSADPRRPFPGLEVQLQSIVRAFNTGTQTEGAATSNLYIDNDSPKLLVHPITSLGVDSATGMMIGEIFSGPKIQSLKPHWRGLYPGDSSSPSYLLVRENEDDEAPTMVLIGALYAISAGFGGIYFDSLTPHVSGHFDWVEGVMNSLAAAQGDTTNYNLQVVDLSRFETYEPFGAAL